MVRSSSMQASPSLQQLSRAFNWWGGDGVIYYTLLVLAAGRVLRRRVSLSATELMATGRPAAYSVVPGPGLLNTTAALST